MPPTSIHVQNAPNARGLNGSEKRQRDDRMDEDARESKREKTDNSDDDGEEMEIEDDDEGAAKQAAPSNGTHIACLHSACTSLTLRADIGQLPATVQQPSARLMCIHLPQEVTDDVLAVLFQQYVDRLQCTPVDRANRGIRYQGFHSVQVVPSPTPNAAGQKAKMAYVTFESPDLATVAKDALDGFTLKKGWVMSVSYI